MPQRLNGRTGRQNCSHSDPKLNMVCVPSSVGARELATALALNTTLTSADLHGNMIGDDGACELAVVLGRTSLYLRKNGIGPAAAGALAAALGLNTLDLGDNHVGAEGCRHLAAALEKNTTLVRLSYNNIRDGCRRVVRGTGKEQHAHGALPALKHRD